MNAPHDDIDGDGYEENGAFTDAKLLFEWVFKYIRYECVLSKTDVTEEVAVRLSSKTDHVPLLPAEDLYAYVPVGVDDKSVLVKTADGTLPPFVNAPVRKGDKIAEAAVYYADQEIARVDLVALEDVDRSFLLLIGSMIATFFRLPIVRTILIVLVLLIAGYVSFVIYANRQRQKKRRSQNSRSKVVHMKDYKK
jgi:D-alanyl-D-alanine carboxypeptidase